jgi:hypothetical protein
MSPMLPPVQGGAGDGRRAVIRSLVPPIPCFRSVQFFAYVSVHCGSKLIVIFLNQGEHVGVELDRTHDRWASLPSKAIYRLSQKLIS